MIKISTDIDFAVQLLNKEKIIGFPTETVYGLAGNIFSEEAINSIFQTKQRPKFNPLIVHISKMEQLEQLAIAIPENARFLAKVFWPGPLTLLLKKHPSVSDLITAGKPTVAVRIPNHKMALAILNAVDFPLAAPSANPFGKISPTSAQHVADFFPNEIEAVFDGGECQNGIESTIIGFDGENVIVYRLGAIAVEEIEAVVGKVKVFTSNDIAPNAPGMLKKHYSPNTNFVLTTDVEKEIEKYQNKRIGVMSFNKDYKSESISIINVLSKDSNFKEASRKLYNVMHQLDKENLDIIIAEKFPDLDLGKSINDRLMRAAEK
ncbi:MAG: threonylcarbamoyl-AMP synthase [Flavobacterium sp.]|nr:threonylcarbamoyl-AMP synthase [Flavobacterium sp.]